jgi:putative ABC transport system ATP-binding protein
LAIQPAVVLADEPTGNLDTANGRKITQLLRELVDQQNQTIVMVTHDQEVGASADRVLHMRDGRLQNDGHAQETPAAARHSRED